MWWLAELQRYRHFKCILKIHGYNKPLSFWLLRYVIFVMSVGAAETVEGGDQLPAGLCPPVVFCQSAWRRAGEMLENVIQH